MNKIKRLLMIVAATGIGSSAFAQFDESGIAAGFFDSSKEKDINFSQFHLPPLAVLLENAKSRKSKTDCRGRSGKNKKKYFRSYYRSCQL